MSAININTASKEQLMQIRGIGDQRAALIITERETKGPLNLEALKNISGIPAHTWDPLVAANKILFEEPTEQAVEETEIDQLKKVMEQMRTENLILKQAEARNVMELKKVKADSDSQLDQLQMELNTLAKQNNLLAQTLQQREAHIEEITTKAAETENVLQQNMKDEIVKQRMLFEEQTTKLQQDNVVLNEERKRLQQEVEKQVQLVTDQDQMRTAQINDLETRLQDLMTKVEEQAHDKQKAEDIARHHEKEKRDQENKIKSLEEEVQHWKTSKAVDDLAPKSIYNGKLASDTKTTTASDTKTNTEVTKSETKPPVEDTKTTEAKSTVESKATEDTKSTEIKTTTKRSTSGQEQWRSTIGPPQFPKLSTYDGTSDWKAYKLQFTHTATRFEWDDQQKLDNLLLCLRGKALKFFSTRPTSVQNNFVDMMDKMTRRFGNKELPHSIRRQLQDVKQQIEESIEEYAERVQELATDGYVDASEDIVEMMATEAFLRGCSDKQAALLAMDKNPSRIDKALQYVKSAIHNRKILLGQKKPEVRKVQFKDVDSDSETELAVRTLNKGQYKPNKDSWKNKLEERVERTERDISHMKNNIEKIVQLLSREGRGRSRSPSPATSPRRQVTCFACNEIGHYSRECPNKKKLTSPVKSSPSKTPLKDQGSRI